MPRLVLICWLCLLLAAAGAQAHESPQHTVEDLTEQMREQGESVPLLLNRASQYRGVGHPEQAIADLQRVLQIEPNHQGAMVELSRIHLAQGQLDAAMQWIQRAIDAIQPGNGNNAHLYAVRGDVFTAQSHYESALADYNRAIVGDGTQVDWYLNRSLMHEYLNRPAERIKGLSQGYESTRSAVLYNEWIEALIDGGQARRALRAIEPQLKQARLKSSWLIRRARARLASGNRRDLAVAAQDDLKTAIAEISARLNLTDPDTDLLLDRALAYLLSGDGAAARRDMALAETHGASPRQVERLRRLELRAHEGRK